MTKLFTIIYYCGLLFFASISVFFNYKCILNDGDGRGGGGLWFDKSKICAGLI